MKKRIDIHTIAGTGLLLAVEIVLQFIGNHVAIGPVSINLSLIPIAIAAIIYGPFIGLFIGVMCGFFVLLAPSTLAIFWPINPVATIFICLLKTGLAGLLAGYLFKWLKSFNVTMASIVAALSIPIVNSGLFALGALTFYRGWLESIGGENIFYTLFIVVIGINFLFEFGATAILSPTISRLIQFANKRSKNKFLPEEKVPENEK